MIRQEAHMGYYAEHLDGELRFKSPDVIRANWKSYTQHLRTLYSSSPNAAELVPDDVSEMSDAEILELLTARMSLCRQGIDDPQCVVPDPDMEKASSSFHIYGIIVDSSCAALLFEPGGEIMFHGEDGEYFGVRITETGYIHLHGEIQWMPIRPMPAHSSNDELIETLRELVDGRPAEGDAEGGADEDVSSSRES